MIDTTGGAKDKNEEEEQPKKEPVLMQEPSSEIQRYLHMTDQLNEHTVSVLEKDDVE